MKPEATILDEIISNKLIEVAELKRKLPLKDLKRLINNRKTPIINFAKSIKKQDKISLIAEIKKSSPSAGVISDRFNHMDLARKYIGSGRIDAISILTDEKYFSGNINLITSVKSISNIPILRKDFIIDEYQVYESYIAGADAILLIVSALNQTALSNMIRLSRDLGLFPLVEAHTIEEITVAVDSGAEIIGINSRDLKTFKINRLESSELLRQIPNEKIRVAESGIENSDDVRMMRSSGADAMLVGTSIIKAADPIAKINELLA